MNSSTLKSIESKELTVFESGTLVLTGTAEALFAFNEFNIEFRFEDSAQQKIELIPDVSQNKLTILCLKFTDNLGTGTRVPIEFAKIEDKKYYVQFATLIIGNGATATRILHYTFFRSK